MTLLTKDALRPGLFRKGEQVHIVTRDRLNTLQESFSALNDKGYQIPLVMEHPGLDNKQSYPVHQSEHERIKELEEDPMFVGWVKDVKVSGDGTLQTAVEVDEGMSKKLTKRGAFVSPQFGPFTDKDKEIHHAIHHVALTRKPVNKDQQKQFLKVAALSEAADLNEEQVYSFSFMDEVLEFGPESNVMPNVSPANPTTNDKDADDPTDDPNTDASKLRRALQQALSTMGVHVANDSPIFNDPDAMQQLITLLHSTVSKNAKDSQMPNKPNQAAAGQTPDGQTPAGTTERQITVTMSQDELDSMKAALAKAQEQIVVLSAANDVQNAALTANHKSALKDRVAKCVANGQMKKEDADGILATIETYQFSQADNLDTKTAIARLETYEHLPKGTFWSDDEKIAKAKVSEFSMSDQPFVKGPQEEMSDERVLKAMEEEGYVNPGSVWPGGYKMTST